MSRLHFHIEYQTDFGEELVLHVIHTDRQQQAADFRMSTLDGRHWSCQMVREVDGNGCTMEYFYGVDYDGLRKRDEWMAMPHRLELSGVPATNYEIYDQWHDMPEDAYLYSTAFTDCACLQQPQAVTTEAYRHHLRLVVRAPQLRSGWRLALCGAHECLGGWQPYKGLAMTLHAYHEWIADIDVTDWPSSDMEFKFVALADDGTQLLWETGFNRILPQVAVHEGQMAVYSLPQAFFPISSDKLAGTLIPIFSLRSATSFGVGDFGDLKKMVDWVASTGQRVLQVLPINDTTTTHTWTDSYPYSCISIFALHPQYADLRQLPPIADPKKREEMETLRQELNALPQIDYERVNAAKTCYLRVLFEQEGATMLKTEAFKTFFHEEESWLVPYARYCYLRDTLHTTDFDQWKGHAQWDEAERKRLSTPRNKAWRDVAFYYFVQFVLSTQMQQAHSYARAKGVILKGDIPIGVSRNGCDVWMEPKYFHMDGQAGAPPDDFSTNGQNWGFPTYNWEAMLQDGCQWWIRRFQNMSKYFDAYRIDHVLGFFRIWEIPIDAVHGLLGQFSPSLGMTREEIEGYGLHFQEDLFTRPFIADWTLQRIFGEQKETVKQLFLTHEHDDIYSLKPEFNTQRKIEQYFSEPAALSGNTDCLGNLEHLRDGLYALVSNVLFVRDRKDADKFHPRISAQLDFMYEALYDCDKAAFNRLYNDYYYRRNNHFWYREAMKKLPRLVQATRMLVCAEDLGMVPDCVEWVMQELRILSLEIQSMPKDSHVRFGHLSQNPYRSVCTISTHDMPTLRQWWDESEERTQDYYHSMLHENGTAPHPLPGWLARDIVSRHLASPSMLCILSIQDWMAVDERIRLADADAERINIPANPRHYWRYRMHMTLEQLMADQAFNTNVSELVIQSGRGQWG